VMMFVLASLTQALAAEPVPPMGAAYKANCSTPAVIPATSAEVAALKKQATANYRAINGKNGSLTRLGDSFNSFIADQKAKEKETVERLEINSSALQASKTAIEVLQADKTSAKQAIEEIKSPIQTTLWVVMAILVVMVISLAVVLRDSRNNSQLLAVMKTVDEKLDQVDRKVDEVPGKTADEVLERHALEDPVVMENVSGKKVTFKATWRDGKFYGLKVLPGSSETYPVRRISECKTQVAKIVEAYLDNNNIHPDANQQVVIARELANSNLIIS